MQRIKNFLKDESGVETIEYAIIAALIAAGVVVIYGAGWTDEVTKTLTKAVTTGQ